jgi:hypothetical protein
MTANKGVEGMSQQPSLSLRELPDWLQVRTVGDLWKALQEGKTPAIAVSAVSLRPPYGPNILQPKFPIPADQLKWDVLERAITLCKHEGGNPAEAMEKLIARIALARWVDRREIINMPLPEFVQAAKQPALPECFVTLLQAASMVNKTKNALEKRAKKSPMPLPEVEGGGGKAAEWKWSTIRPWLEKEFRRQLPVDLPSDRFIRR